jgi:hypothetical protein
MRGKPHVTCGSAVEQGRIEGKEPWVGIYVNAEAVENGERGGLARERVLDDPEDVEEPEVAHADPFEGGRIRCRG